MFAIKNGSKNFTFTYFQDGSAIITDHDGKGITHTSSNETFSHISPDINKILPKLKKKFPDEENKNGFAYHALVFNSDGSGHLEVQMYNTETMESNIDTIFDFKNFEELLSFIV